MQIPRHVIDEISSRLRLHEVAADYVTLEQRGGRFWARCPFHEEKTPSFSVSADENVFYCFGCHKGGNLYQFVQEMENISFPEAVRVLAEKAGVQIPEQAGSEERTERDALIELHNRVTLSFRYLLAESEQGAEARSYLSKRGIDGETAERFALGYAPDAKKWLHGFLQKKGYSNEFLAVSGLFSRRYPEYSFFVNRIIFPIRNARGDTIGFGGRAFGDHKPKYINSPDTELFSKSRSLYGLHIGLPAIRKSRTFVVSEGYMDVLALHQAGIGYCVAPLGTALTRDQVLFLKRYAEKGLLVFDGDAAGVEAAVRAVLICEKADVRCDVIALPEGRDPADFLTHEGSEALQNVLKYPISGFTFVLNHTLEDNDISTADGKEAAMQFLVPFVDAIGSQIRKQSYLEEIADALGVGVDAVRADFDQMVAGNPEGTPRRRPQPQERGSEQIPVTQELFLMMAAAANRGAFSYVRGTLTPDDIRDVRARSLYYALEECYRESESGLDALLMRLEDDALRSFVAAKIATGEFNFSDERMIRQSVSTLRLAKLTQERADLDRNIKKMEKQSPDVHALRSLIEEKMYLDAEIQKMRNSQYE